MSIKDDMNSVKKELSSDEKVLEKAFKLEQVYKKHKFKLWSILFVAIFAIGGNALNNFLEDEKLKKASDALALLEKDSNNKEALFILNRNNPALFELYSYSQAIKEKNSGNLKILIESPDDIISDMSRYSLNSINKTSSNEDSLVFKELSILQDVYLNIEKNNIEEAKNRLEEIDEKSPIKMVANLLSHSIIAKGNNESLK